MGNETPGAIARKSIVAPDDSPKTQKESSIASSRPDGIVGLVQSLNEARVANRGLRDALAALDEKYGIAADCYESAPVGCCGIDALGQVLDINASGAVLLGWSRSAVVGHPLEVFAVVADRARVRDHLQQCISSRVSASTGIRVVDAKGAEHGIHLVSSPFRCPSADGLTLVTTLLDARLLQTLSDLMERLGS
jgi:PAS domain S-box-containing protein